MFNRSLRSIDVGRVLVSLFYIRRQQGMLEELITFGEEVKSRMYDFAHCDFEQLVEDQLRVKRLKHSSRGEEIYEPTRQHGEQ